MAKITTDRHRRGASLQNAIAKKTETRPAVSTPAADSAAIAAAIRELTEALTGRAPELLWDVNQAAAALRVSDGTVRTLIKDGEIPFVEIGHRVLLFPEDVRAYAESKKRTGKPAPSDLE